MNALYQMKLNQITPWVEELGLSCAVMGAINQPPRLELYFDCGLVGHLTYVSGDLDDSCQHFFLHTSLFIPTLVQKDEMDALCLRHNQTTLGNTAVPMEGGILLKSVLPEGNLPVTKELLSLYLRLFYTTMHMMLERLEGEG